MKKNLSLDLENFLRRAGIFPNGSRERKDQQKSERFLKKRFGGIQQNLNASKLDKVFRRDQKTRPGKVNLVFVISQ